MSTAFERITRLLDQIAMEKSGMKDSKSCAPGVEDKVSEARVGAFASDDNAMIDKANMRQPKYGREGSLAAKHGQPRWAGTFTGTDPSNENSKHIYDLTVDFRKYVNKSAAAEVPTEELLRDAAVLGNQLLADIINDAQVPQGHAAAWYDHQGLQKAAGLAASSETSVPSSEYVIPEQQPDPMQVIGLTSGVVYGMQKQAEHHADLVARYLYGTLAEKYAADDKMLADAVSTLSREEDTSASEDTNEAANENESSEDEEEVRVSKKKENQARNKSLTMKEDSENEAEDEEECSECEEDSENENTSEEEEEPGESAAKELASHTAKGAVDTTLSDDEIMNSLGAALAELGLSPEELGQLGGPAGMKLASAFDDFRRKGKFKLEPARTKVKRAARDYIKGYILDLIRPGRAC